LWWNNSANIPGRTTGLNTTFRGGNADGFVAKFDKQWNSYLASTYLGTLATTNHLLWI
jgi:hypothetical protein